MDDYSSLVICSAKYMDADRLLTDFDTLCLLCNCQWCYTSQCNATWA